MDILPPLRLVLLLFLFFGLCAPGGAEIYRWIGADGKTHFGDKPPQQPDSKQVESFQGGAAVSFVGGAGGEVVGTAKVRIFVTQSCPYCKKAKAFLRQRGTPFEELDIERSRSAKAEYGSLGAHGVPVILIGKQRVNGFDAAHLESLLLEAGL